MRQSKFLKNREKTPKYSQYNKFEVRFTFLRELPKRSWGSAQNALALWMAERKGVFLNEGSEVSNHITPQQQDQKEDKEKDQEKEGEEGAPKQTDTNEKKKGKEEPLNQYGLDLGNEEDVQKFQRDIVDNPKKYTSAEGFSFFSPLPYFSNEYLSRKNFFIVP